MEATLYLPQAFEDGLATLITEGKTENIHYRAVPDGPTVFKVKWANPEEKMRAELWPS